MLFSLLSYACTVKTNSSPEAVQAVVHGTHAEGGQKRVLILRTCVYTLGTDRQTDNLVERHTASS